jgi:hypothetical protein
MPEASVYSVNVASGPVWGIRRTEVDRRAAFRVLKASMASWGSVEGKGTVERVSAVKGAACLA